MKILRIALHSLVLTVADIGGIAVGAFAASRILGDGIPLWLQLPIAVALTVLCFRGWTSLLRVFRSTKLKLAGTKELYGCLWASLVWAPLVFIPLHFITQGYWTAVGNLVALAVYQLPVNAIALFGPWGPKVEP
jgi:hypothetical protein